MTTFEMAQKAYENPGKVFVTYSPPLPDPNGFRVKYWEGDVVCVDDNCAVHLSSFQKNDYVWEEERTPRKWSGEYTRNELGVIAGALPLEAAPLGVKHLRVKWEAEEVL